MKYRAYKYNKIVKETDKARLLEFSFKDAHEGVEDSWIVFSKPAKELSSFQRWVPKSLCKVSDNILYVPDYFKVKIFPHVEYLKDRDYKDCKLSFFEASWAFMVRIEKNNDDGWDGFGTFEESFYGSVDGSHLGG